MQIHIYIHTRIHIHIHLQMHHVDLTTYTEFEDLSRLSMSHYRVLADGTKLCSKHNDITFDKAMREKKLKKRDYIYTTTLEPLPDGHSIVE